VMVLAGASPSRYANDPRFDHPPKKKKKAKKIKSAA
jgi:hypothetical protein